MNSQTPEHFSFQGRRLRSAGRVSILALTLALSACGGGGSSASFDISVSVAGQQISGTHGPGRSSTVYVRAGQSFDLDASEPVIWTLYVAGSAFSGSGTAVRYGGADVTLTAVSRSRIAVDTFAPFRLFAPVPITLVATSTYDSALIARVDVLITN